MQNIILRRAEPSDSHILATTRRLVWNETYRGIYPDEKIDCYNTDLYAARDRERIETPGNYYFLFMDGESCVGYFSFGPPVYGLYKDFSLCLNNLYILKAYRGRGLGKTAFSVLRRHCADQGIVKFFCGCNVHNHPARDFYLHMGAVPGDVSSGHSDRSDNIIHYEFYIGDRL